MKLLEHGHGEAPYQLLLAVVAPSRELLEASRAAVRGQREKAVA